jgi:hypothetical protein
MHREPVSLVTGCEARVKGAPMKIRKRTIRGMVVAGLLAAASVPGLAEDRPTPTATATPAQSPTPRPAGGQSLREIGKDTELKGGKTGTPIVISNDNLAEIAEQGSVTSVEKGAGSGAGRRPVRQPGQVTVVESDPQHTDERRRYWRNQYESQVELIESLQRQIQILDQEIPGLWRDFYSRDDPAYRDGVIKPALDAAMARRQKLEEQLATAGPRLTEIKSQARADGAEPGWFRGIPTPAPLPPTPPPGAVSD